MYIVYREGWTSLATEFVSISHHISAIYILIISQVSDSHVVFDVMNEPHDIPAATVFALVMTAIYLITATSYLNYVESSRSKRN